jgi:phosphoglycerol transferase
MAGIRGILPCRGRRRVTTGNVSLAVLAALRDRHLPSRDTGGPKVTTSRAQRLATGDVGWSLAVFALNTILVAVALRLWHADMHVPFAYFGDNLFNLGVVRDVIDHGWFLSNPDLGYPAGQHLADYGAPSGDNLTFALVKALALFTSSPGLIVNLVYVLSFPAVAVVAFLVMRRQGVSAAVAAVCATLFTLVPYHFLRTEGHLFLAFYYAVPLGACLVLDLLAGRQLFKRRSDPAPRLLRWASGRTIGTLAICAVIASGGIYYTVFTLLLLLAVLLVAAVTRQGFATLLATVAVLVALVGVTLVNMAPSILYHAQHGANVYVAQRQPFESELYGLKLMDLVVPAIGHRIDAFNRFQGRYHETTPLLSEPTGSLGIVGTAGFLWLVLVALATMLGGSVRRPAREAPHARERHAAFAVVVAFVVGTVGGISAFIAYAVTPVVRGWSRISIVIAFFSLFAVGLLLDRLRGRLGPSGRGRLAMAAVLGAVLLIGVYDQTNRTYVPNYSANKAEFSSDATFAKAIARAMPSGAAIMQLPYMPFPENPAFGALLDYDLLRPYIHGGGMRWSYGAVKGRPDDWQERFFGVTPEHIAQNLVRAPLDDGRPPRESLAALSAAGFDGVYVDRFGYGGGVGTFERALRRIVGVPLVSPNGRMAFYSLAPYAARLRRQFTAARLRALGTATVKPLDVAFVAFYPPESSRRESWRWAPRRASIEIDNAASTARTARLRTTIETGGPATVTFTLPGGSVVRRRVGNGSDKALVALDIRVRPGSNTLGVATDGTRVPGDGADTRELFMRFIDPVVTEPAATLLPAAKTPSR